MGDMLKGDYKPQSTQQTTQEQLQALVQYLPQLAKIYNQQLLPTEQANLAAQQAVAPGQQALDTNLYATYGPQIAKTTSDIAAQNALANARSDANVLAGPGQDVARAGLAAQHIADPEYYQTRALASDKIAQLLNSIDVNGLSGSDRAETERYINQQKQQGGSPDISSNIKTVENASMFGSALQKKRDSLGQAISQASQFLPASKSGVDVFQQVTGRASMPNNTGAAQATSAQPIGSTANNLTGQLFKSIQDTAQQRQDLEAARRPVTDYVNNAYKASGISSSSMCCFIFMESYNGVLPWWIRKLRDDYYVSEPLVAIGYKRMAKYLVPFMERSTIIRELVNELMIIPLTEYGGWMYSVAGYSNGKSKLKYKQFWFNVWKFIGKI